MEENSLVSIVVPVYNVEQYVGRCVESLIAQTYKNIEIILVDDGSLDGSGVICDQYSGRDQRVLAIHKENGGLSDARNEGIRHVKGKWITFVDSDDFVHPDYIRILYQNVTAYDADISICQYVQTKGGIIKGGIKENTEIYDKAVGMEKLLYQNISTSACAKMYKVELFQDNLFPYGKLYEDVVTVFEAFRRAGRIVLTRGVLYYYYFRGDGIVRTSFTEKKLDYIGNTQYILKEIKREFPSLEKAALSRALWADMHVVVQIGRDKRYSGIQSELWEEIKKYRGTVLRDKKCRLQNKAVMLLSFLGKGVTCGVYRFCRSMK